MRAPILPVCGLEIPMPAGVKTPRRSNGDLRSIIISARATFVTALADKPEDLGTPERNRGPLARIDDLSEVIAALKL